MFKTRSGCGSLWFLVVEWTVEQYWVESWSQPQGPWASFSHCPLPRGKATCPHIANVSPSPSSYLKLPQLFLRWQKDWCHQDDSHHQSLLKQEPHGMKKFPLQLSRFLVLVGLGIGGQDKLLGYRLYELEFGIRSRDIVQSSAQSSWLFCSYILHVGSDRLAGSRTGAFWPNVSSRATANN